MKRIPIFSVGEYNGRKFTEEDLKQVVENFKNLRGVQPVLKLTHSEEQLFLKILAKKYGFDVKEIKDLKGERLIGLGSVKNLEFDENEKKLYAEIDEIPQEFKEFINMTPTRRVSPEFYLTNKGYVLRAVSLVDIPANKNLDKVVFDENDDKNNKMNVVTISQFKEEIKMNDLEKKLFEKEKEFEEMKRAYDELEKKIAKFEEELKAKDELVVKFSEKVKSMKIEKKVDELIANGNISKEHRDLAIKSLSVLNFDENDNNPIFELLSNLKVVDTETYSEKSEEKKIEKNKNENVDEDKELLMKYEELVNKGVDPEEATQIVYGKLLG